MGVFDLSEVSQQKLLAGYRRQGLVVDVTHFLDEHPGGDGVLMEVAGKDATNAFEAIGHSKAAAELLVKYQVGVLHGFDLRDASKDDNKEERSVKGMSAFVIKYEGPTSLIEFVVPLVLACLLGVLVSILHFG